MVPHGANLIRRDGLRGRDQLSAQKYILKIDLIDALQVFAIKTVLSQPAVYESHCQAFPRRFCITQI